MSKLTLELNRNAGEAGGQQQIEARQLPPVVTPANPAPSKTLDFGTPNHHVDAADSSNNVASEADVVPVASTPPLAAILNTEVTLSTDVGDWQERDLTNAPELAQALQERLTHLRDALGAGDVTTALYDTKLFLEQNPNTREFIMPEDVNLFVRALQSSHSIIISKKTTARAKKGATNEKANEIAGFLGDLGL